MDQKTDRMIKRTTRQQARLMIRPNTGVVDLECKKGAWEESTTVVDLNDYADFYQAMTPPKRFVKADVNDTPFDDQEFDFSVACHILEHVENPETFINELMRISKRGYIECPIPIFDNLIRGNETEHRWFVYFDDASEKLVLSPKTVIIPAIFTAREAGILGNLFPNDMVMSVTWEGRVDFEIRDSPRIDQKIPVFWSAMPLAAKFLRLLKLHKF